MFGSGSSVGPGSSAVPPGTQAQGGNNASNDRQAMINQRYADPSSVNPLPVNNTPMGGPAAPNAPTQAKSLLGQ